MARLEIKLFGEIEVALDGQLIKFPTQKAKELFAYLVLHYHHAHPRATLVGLLWPDSDEERAKANLRQTLIRIRRALGETECLRFSGGAVQFHFPDFWCDVLEFERLMTLTPGPFPVERERGGEAEVRALERAVALYRGPFLASIYEDWVLIEQERLQTLYLEALEKLAQVYAERRDYDQAIKTWQRVLREVPWHEQAHRHLIELCMLKGDRSAALRQYEKYAEVVWRELIAASLRRAPRRARSLLGLAAVIGHDFNLAVMTELLHDPEEKTLDDLDSLRRAGLIIERDGHYQFAHDLMRQVVYEELGADRRRLWHRRVGEALETLHSEELDALAGELAGHFEQARLWERAITYAMRAGARAAQSYAYGEAQQFYSTAATLFERLERERPLSARWQRTRLELCRRYLSRDVFPTIYDVRRSSDKVQRVIVQMIALAQTLSDLGALCEAHQHRARLELACGQIQAAQEAMQQAFAVAQQAQDPAVLADVLQGVASLQARCGQYHQAVREYQRYLEALAPLGDERRLGYAWNDLALVQRACGDFVQAQQSLAQANEHFQRAHDLRGQAAVADNLGRIFRDLGRYDEAESSLQRALALNETTGDQRGVGFSLIDLGVLRNDQGRYDDALAYLERVVAMLEQPGMMGFEIEAFSEKARAHLGRGELALALECSTRAITRLEEHGGIAEQAYRYYFTHARILEHNGQTAEARRFLELAHMCLQHVADQIVAESLKTSFIEGVPIHREIARAWQAAQHAH